MKNKTKIFIIFIVIFILFFSINSFLFKTEKVNINTNNIKKNIFDIIQKSSINLDNSNNNIDWTKSEKYKNIINTQVIWKWFFINKYWEFLTNSHLFNNVSSKYYIKINNQKYNFYIVKKYENKDLILWKIINYENNNYLKIQDINKITLINWKWKYNLNIWNKVFTYRNNTKIEWKITWINKNIKEYNLYNLIETNLELTFWDSWSPLFNQYGEIIWINTAINWITHNSYSQIIK